MHRATDCTILIVDDDEPYLHSLKRVLRKDPFRILATTDPYEGLLLMARESVDLVLLDLRMPRRDGLEVLDEMVCLHPEVPVIMLTGHGNVQLAVQAIKQGAADFLEKPCPATVLRQILAHHCHLRRQTTGSTLSAAARQEFAFADLVGDSPPMQRLKSLLVRVAASDAPILLLGESGTGKELAARAIHRHSRRSDQPFCAVDCAALNENVLESELFGHEKGAFTGADKPARGLIRSADRGTLFLDEIGELPLAMQAKLLRTLQEREVRPVGSHRSLAVDLRLVAATNRDLDQAVASGLFRSDLYYRIAAIPVILPPLRERGDDIALLARHILQRIDQGAGKRLDEEAIALLQAHSWPGNVRELENVLRRAVVLAEQEVITPADLPATVVMTDGCRAPRLPEGDSLADYERLALTNALRKTGHNRRRAAQLLGISEATLYRKLKQFDLSF